MAPKIGKKDKEQKKEEEGIKDIDLNVRQLTAGQYVRAIEEIRRTIRDGGESPDRLRFSDNRPVLPLEKTNKDPEIFKIRLHATPTWITLRIRRDNLYLIGIQVGDGRAWALNLDYKVNKGSQPIGFGEDYTDIASAAGHGMTGVRIGRQALIQAVEWLTAPDAADPKDKKPEAVAARKEQRKQRARAVFVLAVMLSEAIRFVPVLIHVRRVWSEANPDKPNLIPGWLSAMTNEWKQLSIRVLRYDANIRRDPDRVRYYRWEPVKLEIEIGVLKEIDNSVLDKEEAGRIIETRKLGGDTLIKFEARTPDELLKYLGVLQRGTTTMEDLKQQPA